MSSKKIHILALEVLGRIKDYIESEGMTQSYISRKMGFPPSKVSKILNQEQNLSLDFVLVFLEQICKDDDIAYYILTGKKPSTLLMKELCSIETKNEIQSIINKLNKLLKINSKYQK